MPENITAHATCIAGDQYKRRVLLQYDDEMRLAKISCPLITPRNQLIVSDAGIKFMPLGTCEGRHTECPILEFLECLSELEIERLYDFINPRPTPCLS